MRVVLATGIEKFEEDIKHQLSKTDAKVMEQIYYLESVHQIAMEQDADIVVLASTLPGSVNIEEVLSMLRMADKRIVLLPDSVRLGKAALSLGIYDILMGGVNASQVVDLILNPSTYSYAANSLKGGQGSTEREVYNDLSLKQKNKQQTLDSNKPTEEREKRNKPSLFDTIGKPLAQKLTKLFSRKEKKERKQDVYIPEKPIRTDTEKVKQFRTKVLVVVGAAHKVGATSFTLALAETLAKKNEVRVLDAGGGASKWLGKASKIPCSKMPPATISPGVITIVDAGTEIPAEAMPLVETTFVVTDMSREAVNLHRFSTARGVVIVGNRSAPEEELKSLASVWGIKVLCNLPEDVSVKKAELSGLAPGSKLWRKQLKKIVL